LAFHVRPAPLETPPNVGPRIICPAEAQDRVGKVDAVLPEEMGDEILVVGSPEDV
jgi:hypothetical protein